MGRGRWRLRRVQYQYGVAALISIWSWAHLHWLLTFPQPSPDERAPPPFHPRASVLSGVGNGAAGGAPAATYVPLSLPDVSSAPAVASVVVIPGVGNATPSSPVAAVGDEPTAVTYIPLPLPDVNSTRPTAAAAASPASRPGVAPVVSGIPEQQQQQREQPRRQQQQQQRLEQRQRREQRWQQQWQQRQRQQRQQQRRSGNGAASAATSGVGNATGSSPVTAGGDSPAAVTYIALPLPDANSTPVSFKACCGIGHRLVKNLRTMVYGVSRCRLIYANWTDVPWNALFNDTANIRQGPATEEVYSQNNERQPKNWSASPLAWHEEEPAIDSMPPAYYGYSQHGSIMFGMPLAHSIAKSLADNLSPLVLSFLAPMRAQYAQSDLHLCVHVREGNNETGHFVRHERRIALEHVLNTTLASMKMLAEESNATKVTVFVASDAARVRPLFEKEAPAGWHVVKPARELPRPKQGVWFGEWGSRTNKVLSKDKLNEAMAEAVADVFALGECDALFIPAYSGFSVVGIMLTRAKRRKVLFLGGQEYIEYPEKNRG